MKTAMTPLLMAVVGIVLCLGAQALAQDGLPQQAPIPYAQQPMAAPPQYDNGAYEGAPQVNGAMAQGHAFPLAADGGVVEGGMLDNGLWEGAPEGTACSICGGGNCTPPDWYTQQGVRILSRSRSRDLPIGSIFDNNTGNFKTVLTSRSAAPDVAAAYAMTIGHYFAHDKHDRDHFVEFSFWGLDGWKDTAERRGNGDLYSQFLVNGNPLAGFDAADLQSIYYASFANNYELNGRFTPRARPDRLVLQPNGKWRRECKPGTYMSYLYGIRFFQENETFHFHGQSTTNGVTSTGDYNISSHNCLLGLQIGADLSFRKCRWEWGFRAKVGPYINFSDHESEIDSGVALAPTFTRRLNAAKHEASLIGETGFFATYKFRPDLIGRASYDFMWVTGVVLAPEQLQFDPNTLQEINTNGTILYQGLSLSLEWLW